MGVVDELALRKHAQLKIVKDCVATDPESPVRIDATVERVGIENRKRSVELRYAE
jgi:hypothetical protein